MSNFPFGNFIALFLIFCATALYAQHRADTTRVCSIHYPEGPPAHSPAGEPIASGETGLLLKSPGSYILPCVIDAGNDNYEKELIFEYLRFLGKGKITIDITDAGTGYGYSLSITEACTITLSATGKSGAVKAGEAHCPANAQGSMSIKLRRLAGSVYVFVNNNLVIAGDYRPYFPKAVKLMAEGNTEAVLKSFSLVKFPVKINLTSGADVTHSRENMGSYVNTENAETHPVITADGSFLSFQRNTTGEENAARHLQVPLHNYEAVSEAREVPGSLPAIPGFIHTFAVDQKSDFTSSQDQRIVISSIANAGTGHDLYISTAINDSLYSSPKPLTDLNTVRDEISPFLAPDGRTLYFLSNGHQGFGKMDLFMSTATDASLLHWTGPVNMGPAFNTHEAESGMSTDAHGMYAFVSSSAGYAGARGHADIYKIMLPPALRPKPTVQINVKTVDGITGMPSAAKVYIADTSVSGFPGSVRSGADGLYTHHVPVGSSYRLYAEKDGYMSTSESITVIDHDAQEIKITLVPVEPGSGRRLNHVYFAPGSWTLLPSSLPELERLARTLLRAPELSVELTAHTDKSESDGFALELTAARLKAVMDKLTRLGVPAHRMQGVAAGSSEPFAPNDSEEGRRLNNRMEAVLIAAADATGYKGEIKKPGADKLMTRLCTMSLTDFLKTKTLQLLNEGKDTAGVLWKQEAIDTYGKAVLQCPGCQWLAEDSLHILNCPGMVPLHLKNITGEPVKINQPVFAQDAITGMAVIMAGEVEAGSGKNKMKIIYKDNFPYNAGVNALENYLREFPHDPRAKQLLAQIIQREQEKSISHLQRSIDSLVNVQLFENALRLTDSLLTLLPNDTGWIKKRNDLQQEANFKLHPEKYMADAIRLGDTETAIKLINFGALKNASPEEKADWLFAGVFAGDVTLVNKLYTAGIDIETRNATGATPLLKAADWSKKEIIFLLLQHGAHADAKNNEGENLVHRLVNARLYIEDSTFWQSMPVNKADNEGNTPLHKAVNQLDNRYVELLTRHRATANKQNRYGFTPLCLAVLKYNPEIIKNLVKNGADVIYPCGPLANTPLHEATGLENGEMIEILIKLGAKMNAPNLEGDTPLHTAVRNRKQAAIDVLIKNGADQDIKNKEGDKPGKLAKKLGFKELTF